MTRRLDEFEQILDICLEQIQSGQKSLDSALAQYPGIAAELRPRLEAALWLDGRKSSLDPRPGFVAASRNRLLSQIKSETITKPAAAQTPKDSLLLYWWQQLIPQGPAAGRKFAFQLALIIVFLFTTVTGGRQVALAAQDAIPGDPLYPVKITLERVEMVTTLDLAEEIRLHTEFARNRLIEVQELVLEGRYAYIPETLARFGGHVNQAVSKLETLARQDAGKALAMASFLHESLSDQMVVLDILMDTVPLAFQPDITRALIVTGSAIIVVEEVDSQTGGNSYATPTSVQGTDDDNVFELQQTDSLTTTLSPSSTATETLVPSFTPTLPASATVTPSASSIPRATLTSTPGSGGGDGDADPTATKPPPPTATDEPPPPPTEEPKPTNTKKPLPSPTRRPPKPTKESK